MWPIGGGGDPPQEDYMQMSTDFPSKSPYMRLEDTTPKVSDECAEVVKGLQEKFTSDQLSSLAHMLQKLQVVGGVSLPLGGTSGEQQLGLLLTQATDKLTDAL